MKTQIKTLLLIGCIAFGLLIEGKQVMAQEVGAEQAVEAETPTALDEKIVKDFLTELFGFYTFDKPDMPPMLEFVDKHIDSDARFVSEIHLNELVEPQFKRFNREQILKNIKESYEKAYNSSAKYKMESLTFSEESQKAHAQYHVWTNMAYESKEPSTGRRAEIRIKSLSLCDDDFGLVEGVLKILKSSCVQDVIIAKPVFLE